MTNRAGRLLTSIDRAAGGLPADLFLYAVSAAFALVTAQTSTLLPHRAWGAIAWWAYAAALLLVLVQLWLRRRATDPDPRLPGTAPMLLGRGQSPYLFQWPGRTALSWLTWVTAAVLPLIVEAAQRAGGRTDRAQDEVLVVERMGERLLHTGTPYLGPEAIRALPAGDQLGGYSPYQPGMAVFGLPRAIAGAFWWTDARVWFALVTAGALIVAVRIMAPGGLRVRAIQAVTVLPICSLTLATGGDDLPVLALCLLALALVGRSRFGWAGVAVGSAAACKLFALPVVAVLVVLAVATRGWRLLPWAIGLPILVLIPPVLINGDAFVENVIRFPLGHGIVASPAQSPFPGYLIAHHLPGGRYLAAALLVAVAVAVAVRLLRRPPRTAAGAALISGYGLLVAILLMPTTRFGYLLYPIAFLVWAPALAAPRPVSSAG